MGGGGGGWQGASVAGLVAAPVTIKNIEYAIINRGFEEGWVSPRLDARGMDPMAAAALACEVGLEEGRVSPEKPPSPPEVAAGALSRRVSVRRGFGVLRSVSNRVLGRPVSATLLPTTPSGGGRGGACLALALLCGALLMAAM